MKYFILPLLLFACYSLLPAQAGYYALENAHPSDLPLWYKAKAPQTRPPQVSFHLFEAHPNPVTGYLTLQYDIHQAGHYVISVVGSQGRAQEQLLNQHLEPGTYKLLWHTSPAAHGIYMYQLLGGQPSDYRNLILFKF